MFSPLATGTENAFELGEFYAQLAPIKSDGIFITGCTQAGWLFGENNEYGHQSSGTGALTARATEGTNNGTGPSLDQFIGQELQKSGVITPRRSLLWGLHNNTGNWGPWYEAAGKPASPQSNPYKALADLVPGMSGGPDVSLLRKKFILDNAYKDCRSLAADLGVEGRQLLDFHCTNIESLQKSVVKSFEGLSTGMCKVPTNPATKLAADANFDSADNYDEVMGAFSKMIPLAFTCDVTRVIGISFGGTAARFAIPSKYGIPSSSTVDSGDSGPQHHAWTHRTNDGTTGERLVAMRGFYNWYSSRVLEIVQGLKNTMDVDGSPLLDSTLVLWTSELGTEGAANSHPQNNVPVMMFGNSKGAIKTTRLLAIKYGGKESALLLHQLFNSIIHHVGLTGINRFGKVGDGPLDWLKG